ncbi:MAG TPA: response regulator [Pirellulales bacterium]|jgi:chemotaxis family two-component system response regulator Rcp1|nr:response regulator [Pirellulales bacterium]
MPIEILLAEDDPAEVCLMREALAQSGLDTRLNVVCDGIELVDYLHQRGEHAAARRPDIILLDLNMPRKSGAEALAEVKRDPAFRAIPVIVLTTSTSRDDVARSYELCANCFISKPADLHRFFDIVRLIERFWFEAVTLP